MNDTDVQAKTQITKPKFHKNINLFFKSDWLITMLFLGQHNMPHLVKSGFCASLAHQWISAVNRCHQNESSKQLIQTSHYHPLFE